jgi:hypothetical protein
MMTLFDPLHPSDPRSVVARPRARKTDPSTAHAAAKQVESGNGPLMQAIRKVLIYHAPCCGNGPASAFTIAAAVRKETTRWKEGTIRSAVSRAPFLRWVDNDGRVPDTGNPCRRYVLKDDA